MSRYILTDTELKLLLEAKMANPYWFAAVTKAASVMVDRRRKYSGQNHPYYNFVDMAYRQNTTVFDLCKNHISKNILQIGLTLGTIVWVFRFYLNIKASRLGVSDDDFPDERLTDTLIDIINYAAIALGWFLGKLTLEKVVPYEQWTRRNRS